jgi:hypothetical protein
VKMAVRLGEPVEEARARRHPAFHDFTSPRETPVEVTCQAPTGR